MFNTQEAGGKIIIRCRTIDSCQKLNLPTTPNTYTDNILWLGPDEWMILTPYNQVSHHVAKLQDAELNSVVDVSDHYVSIEINQKGSHQTLQKACALDLRTLDKGEVVQTLLGRCNIILQCLQKDHYIIHTRTSFADYTKLLLATCFENTAN